MRFLNRSLGLIAALLLLTNCGGNSSESSGNGGGGQGTNDNRIDWNSVPSDILKSVEDTQFDLNGIEQIDLNLFGSNVFTEIVYTDTSLNQGTVRIFKLQKNYWPVSSVRAVAKGPGILELNESGQYKCSIKVENHRVTVVDGSCHVHIQVSLPKGSTIEVYDNGRLLTRRFRAMTAENLVDNVDDASFDKDRMAAIDSYLDSHRQVSGSPSLTSQQLGQVVDRFSFKDAKFAALRKLHIYVSDRQNLGQMIEDTFSHFEQDEARRIVGL